MDQCGVLLLEARAKELVDVASIMQSESEIPARTQVPRGAVVTGRESHSSDLKPMRSIRDQGEAGLQAGGAPATDGSLSPRVSHA